MSDDSLIDTTEKDKRRKMALLVGGALLALQAMLLLTYRSYLDFGHLMLSILFAVVALTAFWSLLKARLFLPMFCIVFATFLLYVQVEKVKWNEDYLQKLATSDAFILEDYIDEYPMLEEHVFARLLGRQDWVRFADQCIGPALKQRPVMGTCREPDAIEKKYGINVNDAMQRFVQRMQKTAQDIEAGRIQSGGQYQTCIAQKRCAPIALLPDDVDADKLVNDNTQFVEVRQAFWDLVEGKGLTPSVCLTMTLCRGLLASGVVSFSAPQAGDMPSAGADE